MVVEIVKNAMPGATGLQNMSLFEHFSKNGMKHFIQDFSKHENDAQFDHFISLGLIYAINNSLNTVICRIACLFCAENLKICPLMVVVPCIAPHGAIHKGICH